MKNAMPCTMKIQSLALILAAALILGCTQSTIKESKNVDLPNQTDEGALPATPPEKQPSLEHRKLPSVLYDLTVAPEPEPFAKQNDISLLHDKVKVFIYFIPASLKSERKKALETHHVQVEKQSNDLARAWVPVNQLIPLSKEPAILMIRLPKTLIKTDGKSND